MATTYKFITDANLTKYSKLVKAAISTAETNAETAAAGALAEAQKKEVLPIGGIVSGVEILSRSTSTYDDVVYDSKANTFAARVLGLTQTPTYYNVWATDSQYIDTSDKTPLQKTYIDINSKEVYYYDGSSMILVGATDTKIDKGSLATINGQSLEDGGDIELDFTVAEFVTTLPALSSASKSKIYLVPSDATGTNNSYKEYIKVTVSGADKWEQIGEYKTEADLTPYLKKTDAASTYVAQVSGKGLSTNDYTTTEKTKLAGIATNANNYTLPTATSSALGGIKIGFTASGKDYPVVLNSSNQAYVNVPWTDTSYTLPTASTSVKGGVMLGESSVSGLYMVDGTKLYILRATASNIGGVQLGYTASGKNYPLVLDNSGKAYVNVPWTDTTYSAATQSANGLMSAADKKIVDTISTTYVAQSSISSITDTEIETLWNNA